MPDDLWKYSLSVLELFSLIAFENGIEKDKMFKKSQYYIKT